MRTDSASQPIAESGDEDEDGRSQHPRTTAETSASELLTAELQDAEGQPARGSSWTQQLDSSSFSVTEAIGGWRGATESLLPGLVFVVAYVVTRQLQWPLILAGGIAVVFIAARLLQRSSLTQAFAGMFGVLIGVVWAALSGRAENYFAWGLITNAAFLSAMVVSLLLRRPAVSLLMQYAVGLPEDWKAQPWAAVFMKRTAAATWVWAAVFGIRLAVQLPLYLGGHVAWLGVLKLVLGLPLFAVGGWLNWVLLRGVVPKDQIGQ